MRPRGQDEAAVVLLWLVRIGVIVAVCLLGAPSVHAWWDTDWKTRLRLTFDNSSQAQNLDDFPVLIVLDPGNIDYARTDPGGLDLRFVDADDSTVLKYEIEKWTPGGTSYIWVRVPRINGSSSSDFIYLYYDNTGAPYAQDPPGVWAVGYVAVWHLDDNPTGAATVLDSTVNAKHGTSSASMNATNVITTGQIGKATDFDGSADYVRVPSGAGDVLEINGNDMTMESWVRRNGSTPGNVWMAFVGRQLGTASAPDSYVQALHFSNPSQALGAMGGGGAVSSAGAITDLTWRYVAVTKDASFVTQYVSGGQDGRVASSGPVVSDPNDVTIGAMENDGTAIPTEWYVGALDEIRISDVTRSADWVAAQYLSMTDNFVTFTSDVSGTVFEDVNYGGGAGRDLATSAADAPSFTVASAGVTVELYDAAGNHVVAVSPQTTNAAGAYSFTGLAAGTYTVRVVTDTVTSSRPGSDGSELGTQVYRVDGDGEALGAGAKKVGGERPSNEDAAANSGAQTLAALQGTDLDSDLITEWTQSIVQVDLSGGAVNGVDFGFNFDVVVNTNDAGQGSLRQFILNSNLLN